MKTSIEWTGYTWNPCTGCTKISAGCKHCYAEQLSHRLQRMGNARYANGFKLTLHWDKVGDPTRWRDSRRIFVNSMSDLLHLDVPNDFIMDVFETMGARAPWHEYQVLTKRADRWPETDRAVLKRFGRWPSNIVPAVTVENRKTMHRAEHLAQVGDHVTVRMVSVEPLLEDLGKPDEIANWLLANRIGWLVSGGESGWSARAASIDWFRHLRDGCRRAGVPYFHKQHGGRGVTEESKLGGELATIDGELHKALPTVRIPSQQGVMV